MPAPQKSRDDESGLTFEERRALNDLFSLTYEELRRLASFVRKNQVNPTINSTALVHEAWMKLKDSPHLGVNISSPFQSGRGEGNATGSDR